MFIYLFYILPSPSENTRLFESRPDTVIESSFLKRYDNKPINKLNDELDTLLRKLQSAIDVHDFNRCIQIKQQIKQLESLILRRKQDATFTHDNNKHTRRSSPVRSLSDSDDDKLVADDDDDGFELSMPIKVPVTSSPVSVNDNAGAVAGEDARVPTIVLSPLIVHVTPDLDADADADAGIVDNDDGGSGDLSKPIETKPKSKTRKSATQQPKATSMPPIHPVVHTTQHITVAPATPTRIQRKDGDGNGDVDDDDEERKPFRKIDRVASEIKHAASSPSSQRQTSSLPSSSSDLSDLVIVWQTTSCGCTDYMYEASSFLVHLYPLVSQLSFILPSPSCLCEDFDDETMFVVQLLMKTTPREKIDIWIAHMVTHSALPCARKSACYYLFSCVYTAVA